MNRGKGVVQMKKWTIFSFCAVAAIVLIAAYAELEDDEEKEEI